jgi:hypothetical protein
VTLVELAGVEHLLTLDESNGYDEVTSTDRSLVVCKTCLDVRAVAAAAAEQCDCPPSPSTVSPHLSPRLSADADDAPSEVRPAAIMRFLHCLLRALQYEWPNDVAKGEGCAEP